MTEIPVDRTAERIDIDVRDRIIIRGAPQEATMRN